LNEFFCIVISDFMIMEGKAAIYKRGYRFVLRQLKKRCDEIKSLKKEVRRLNRLMQMHEDMFFAAL
jgi:hypothetical protein